MLLIPCPYCGDRPEDEFGFGGDATAEHPAESDREAAGREAAGREAIGTEAYADYLYLRDNPKGRHRELWVHRYGCQRWLVVERDTVTHAIHAARAAVDGRGDDR